jgi:hypothetical protein
MYQTGVRSTGIALQAFTKRDSGEAMNLPM